MSAAVQGRDIAESPLPQVLDLRHYGAHTLRPLLEAESRMWGERMDWDYRASTDLLLQYLDARVLPGFVAVEAGRVVGYTFCVYEERKAILGDLFAVDTAQASRSGIEHLLLGHMLELLTHSPGVERIEAQLLLHRHGDHLDLVRHAGFRACRRLFMECDLSTATLAPDPAGAEAHGFGMRPWQEGDFQAAGSLIARAYEGHIDAEINDQYRSLAGSHRFLHNIIRFPGCGLFDAEASRVVGHRPTGTIAALLLCSRVRKDVAHVTQACVAPQARGMGLATLMLLSSMEGLRQRGFSKISLTVTEGNTKAEALYARLGFSVRHDFDALVWTQPGDSTF